MFERLAHDVQFGTRLTLSSDPDLLSSFKLSVQGALQKQCHAMETTLQRYSYIYVLLHMGRQRYFVILTQLHYDGHVGACCGAITFERCGGFIQFYSSFYIDSS